MADEIMNTAQRQKRKLRPEAVMGIIALVCAALLVGMTIACIPYFQEPKDPELLTRPQHMEAEEEARREEAEGPEETVPEETAIPTIPPEANPYDRYDFQYNDNNFLECLRQESFPGVDVSAFQGNIDWQQVKDAGIRFAIIRLGYRGYGKAGKMVEDEYALKNLKGVTEAGLPYGVYFFSQALNIKEAQEEIDFMLKILGDYHPDLPVILDWEIPTAEARTANMDARTLTDIQLYFCKTIQEMGYTPMIYFNWHQGNNLYYLNELEDYPFWLALYQDRMDYPYKVEMWQYTCTGKVPGIPGDVDINVYMP